MGIALVANEPVRCDAEGCGMTKDHARSGAVAKIVREIAVGRCAVTDAEPVVTAGIPSNLIAAGVSVRVIGQRR